MKYVKKFSTNADYQAFTEGENYITPNICYITELKELKFKPKVKQPSNDNNLIPNNEIWYTTIDEKITTVSYVDGFNANIISNTYENGKGVIKFDNTLTTIGDSAFIGNTNLKTISLPNSITLIDSMSFAHAKYLEVINCQSTTPPLVNEMFDIYYLHSIILVPDNSVTTYKTSNSWVKYSGIIIGYNEYINNNFIIINSELNLSDIYNMFVEKYGNNYGSKYSPKPLDENVIILHRMNNYDISGKATFISIVNSLVRLYCDDHDSTYYCFMITKDGQGTSEFYD